MQTLPYKNAVKFVNEKEHFNYTTFFVSLFLVNSSSNVLF